MKHLATLTKTLFILIAIAAIPATLPAQEIYKTIHGDIAITIIDHDSTILAVSNELNIKLDYETSKITLRVGYETFSTRIDSIDAKFRSLRGNYLEYTGKLGITINTQNFSPQRYPNMEGQLTSVSPPVAIKGNGSMTCIPAGDKATPACTLLVALETTLSTLQLQDIFATAKETVRIDVRQSILERENE